MNYTENAANDNNNIGAGDSACSIDEKKSSHFIAEFLANPAELTSTLKPLFAVPSRNLNMTIAAALQTQLEHFQYSPAQNIVVNLLASEIAWARHHFAPHYEQLSRPAPVQSSSHGKDVSNTPRTESEQTNTVEETSAGGSTNVSTAISRVKAAASKIRQSPESRVMEENPAAANSPSPGSAKSKHRIGLKQQPETAAVSESDSADKAGRVIAPTSEQLKQLDFACDALCACLKAVKFLADYQANSSDPPCTVPTLNATLVKSFITHNCLPLLDRNAGDAEKQHLNSKGSNPAPNHDLIVHHLFSKYIYFFGLYDCLLADRFPVLCDQRELCIRTVNSRAGLPSASSCWILPLCEAMPVKVLQAIGLVDSALTRRAELAEVNADRNTDSSKQSKKAQSMRRGNEAEQQKAAETPGTPIIISADEEVKVADSFSIKVGTIRKLVCSALIEALGNFQSNLRPILRRREQRFITAAKLYADTQEQQQQQPKQTDQLVKGDVATSAKKPAPKKKK